MAKTWLWERDDMSSSGEKLFPGNFMHYNSKFDNSGAYWFSLFKKIMHYVKNSETKSTSKSVYW